MFGFLLSRRFGEGLQNERVRHTTEVSGGRLPQLRHVELDGSGEPIDRCTAFRIYRACRAITEQRENGAGFLREQPIRNPSGCSGSFAIHSACHFVICSKRTPK
jgi:hypothetical protein